MRKGRPLPILKLSSEERETLERWARRPKSAQALAQRARVVLACAQEKTNTVVSAELKLSRPAVGKWRRRFVTQRLDGLLGLGVPVMPLVWVTNHLTHMLKILSEYEYGRSRM